MSPLPTKMANHWWQRPGRHPGRLLYQWHLAFHDQPQMHKLVDMAQSRIKNFPGLDMVDVQLLHLTTYIVGFADEISQSTVDEMVAGTRQRLTTVAPIPITIGRIGYHPQAVTILVEPPDALTPVLDAVRDAATAAGCHGHTDTDPWRPHISIAYSHTDDPAAPIIAALGRSLPQTQITIKSISLVSQTQVGHSWQWKPVVEVLLGGAGFDGTPQHAAESAG
jgi:2'-5' RNA ligase